MPEILLTTSDADHCEIFTNPNNYISLQIDTVEKLPYGLHTKFIFRPVVNLLAIQKCPPSWSLL